MARVGRRKVRRVLAEHRGRLNNRKGVVGTGCGRALLRDGRPCPERGYALRVYVERKIPSEDLGPRREIPKRIDGVPTDVIELEVGLAEDVSAARLRSGKFEPLVGGIGMGRAGACGVGGRGTLGAIVKDKAGNFAVLTNQHVIADGSCSMYITGCEVAQPSGATGDHRVGYLHADKDWWRNAKMDAAAPLLYAETVQERGVEPRILKLGRIAAGFGVIRKDALVRKMGSSTNKTTGKIDDEDFNYPIPCTDSTQVVNMRHQVLIRPYFRSEPFAAEGDSGALVLDRDNRPVALLHAWAKYASGMIGGIATPIRPVLEKLEVTLYR